MDLSEYEKLSELIRTLLIKRLTHTGGHRFALVCLTALIKDDKLSDLLSVPERK